VVAPDGVRIAIERFGKGKPLLAVHGAAGSRKRWLPLAERFSGREFITMDRRGRGDSTDGTGAYAIESEFADIAAVVDHLGEVDLLGHSYGAICAIGAAIASRRIGRMILYEPPFRYLTEGADDDLAERLEQRMAAGDPGGALKMFMRHAGATEADVERLSAHPSWPERLALMPTLPREVDTAHSYSFPAADLARIKIPVLLLLGSESPSFFKVAIDMLASNLPNAQVQIFKGQKHQAMDTASDLFVDTVQTFLAGQG